MDRGQVVRFGRWAVVLMAGASLAACSTITPKYAVREGAQGSAVRPPSSGKTGTNAPYQVGGIWYVPHEQPRYDETGIASWYGDAFNMKATADGEVFDMNQFSAAHTTLPLPSMVEVTNLDNGRKLVVRVNDRGPFVGGRIIDLSHAAAIELGYDRAGVAHVRVKYVGPAPLGGPEAGVRYAKASPQAYSPRPYPPQPYAAAPAYAPPLRAASYGSGTMTAHRPADEEIFGEAPAAPAAVEPLVPRPQRVAESSLTPLPPAVRSTSAAPFVPESVTPAKPPLATPVNRASRDPYISDVVARRVQPVAQRANLEAATGQSLPAAVPSSAVIQAVATTRTPSAKAYSVQAGAFSDQVNAKRAAAQLASAGTVKVEPFERSGVTMYRVYLAGVSDEAEAHEVRDKVAAIGFSDARVVKSPGM
jgi:rare lipoprotein A